MAAALSLGAVGIVAITSSARHETVTADGPRGDRPVRDVEITVPGVASPIRVSRTAHPVRGYGSFGSIPLAGGSITGGVQTTRADGASIVIVAITGGPATRTLEVRGPSGEVAREDLVDGQALVVLELEQPDPQLVVDVAALDAAESTIGSARVTPFVQDPISCGTNTEFVDADEAGAATYVGHLDAYLAAPLPAAGCEEGPAS